MFRDKPYQANRTLGVLSKMFTNRARWPYDDLWRELEEVVNNDLLQFRTGVLPNDVIQAKMRELDALLSGLLSLVRQSQTYRRKSSSNS